ncbi:MAG TPA: hypothetical protein VFK41_06925 [Nocardioidaceae bacterium]|nr:hypothetical protein [Nocardioidaceae bacterium]
MPKRPSKEDIGRTVDAGQLAGQLTSEPPTRSPRVCTPPPGVNGAARRFAMTFGHR